MQFVFKSLDCELCTKYTFGGFAFELKSARLYFASEDK